MKTCFILLIFVMTSMLAAVCRITSDLSTIMLSSRRDTRIPIQITMQEQYNSRELLKSVQGMTPQNRKAMVRDKLKTFTQESQADLLVYLGQQGAQNIVSLWINNTIVCETTPDIINSISGRNEIAGLDWNEERNLLIDAKGSFAPPQPATRETTSNVIQVNADDVWNLGFTGEDVIVALLDTGVRYSHLDLADQMWTSTAYPNHGYDFVNNDNNPMDDNGHGTHCAGTIVGNGTAGSQTGIAPGARLMAIKVSSSTGTGTESNVWLGYQFALDNGAHVISQSLGWSHSWNPNRAGWRQALENLNAAGIPAVVANGNDGNYLGIYPVPDNVCTPADCPPPWRHPDQTLAGGATATIAVGAVTDNDTAAYFTSHGPTSWENVPTYMDFPYQPEMGLIRPDVSAPGVNIKSLSYMTDIGYTNMNGTSMAAPCVAGVVALMLSKNPGLDPAEINQLLEITSMHLTTVKSNLTGSGRVDALAAINEVAFPSQPPNTAEYPAPVNTATNVLPALYLSWFGGIDTNTFTLYCGTDNPPTNLLNGIQTSLQEYCNPQTMLNCNTTYFWKVDTTNSFGTTVGPIWSFTTGGASDESFESGNLWAFGWEAGELPWAIDTTTVLHGRYSMRSSNTVCNSTSSIYTNRVVFVADTLRFFLKASCQSSPTHSTDYMDFLINGAPHARCDGITEWIEFKHLVQPGSYEFAWRYYKDAYVDAGDDCVWVDYISFPPCNNPPYNVEAQMQPSGVILLSWHSPDDASYVTGYKIYVNGEFSNIVASSPVTLTGTLLGYNSYQISAMYSTVDSPLSEIVNVVYLPCPTNLDAQVSEKQVILTWDAPAISRQALGYRIYRNNIGIQYIDINQSPANTATDSPGASGTYTYYVSLLYTDGESVASNHVSIDLTVGNEDNTCPTLTGINSIYPNPFTSELKIGFGLAARSEVKLEVYNLKGQLVKTVVSTTLDKASYQVAWDGTDTAGKAVTQGIYFIRFKTSNLVEMHKVMLVR